MITKAEEMTQDDRDMIMIANFRGGNVRCPGGRIVPEGYVCIHCGHDYSDDRKCGKSSLHSIPRNTVSVRDE